MASLAVSCQPVGSTAAEDETLVRLVVGLLPTTCRRLSNQPPAGRFSPGTTTCDVSSREVDVPVSAPRDSTTAPVPVTRTRLSSSGVALSRRPKNV